MDSAKWQAYGRATVALDMSCEGCGKGLGEALQYWLIRVLG